MSYKVMEWVLDNGPQGITDRLVMVALGRFCDRETGTCYPSIQSISDNTAMTDRGVQKALQRLEADGWIVRDIGGGRGRKTIYSIPGYIAQKDERGSGNGPAENPEQGCINPERHSVNVVTETPNKSAKTPNTETETPNGGSPEPSKEPSKERSVVRNEAREIAKILEAFASPGAVSSFIAHRRRLRKPLSVTAATRMTASLQEILDDGHDPSDALALAEEKGWVSIKADWYRNEVSKHDNRNRNPNAGRSPGTGTAAAFAAVALERSHGRH